MRVKVVYPPHVWKIREIRASADAGDTVGEILEDHTRELDENLTVLSSRESGIARREALLGILAKTTDTLEDRRVRVHLRWYNKESYTETSLREKLDGVLGKENYELVIRLEEKTVEVRIFEAGQSVYKSVAQLLEDVVPLDYLIDVMMFRKAYVLQHAAVVSIGRTQCVIRDKGVEVMENAEFSASNYNE